MTQDKQNPPVFQLFTVSETADALHLHLSTLRRLIRAGDLPVVRIGGAIRIDPEELRRFIDAHRFRRVLTALPRLARHRQGGRAGASSLP